MEEAQLRLQIETFTITTKVQLLAIARDLFLNRRDENKESFSTIYRNLEVLTFGEKPKE